jgi:hypothetical protein
VIAAVVLAGALACGAQDDYSMVLAALVEEDIPGAQRIVAESSGLGGHRARTELAYRTRDFEGALAAGEAGLAEFPGDLILVHRAVQSAVWLRRAAAAERLASQFDAALSDARLGDDERAWWEAEAAGLTGQVVELGASEELRHAAEARGRLVSLCGLAVMLLILAALAGGATGERALRTAD